MSREADYTIQGFIYQFNKSLDSLLSPTGCDSVVVEGIIEDIEVRKGDEVNAIQCKYHEAQDKFQLSAIYKPILQMMEHFYDNGNTANGVKYKLYSYFPNETEGSNFGIKHENIEEVLETKNGKSERYVTKLKGNINISEFLKCFSIEFGLSMDNLIQKIKKSFLSYNFKEEEIDTMIYPNAVQMIAEASIKHHATEREVGKADFINRLRNTRRTAITKWTMALKNHKQILETRRKQLQNNLSHNSRTRYFIISEECVENFEEYIVNFIKEYVDKYHCKILHDKTPLFCLDCSIEKFSDIETRLYKKGVIFNGGFINSGFFDIGKLFKEPMVTYVNKHKIKEREFVIRIIHHDRVDSINHSKCDDLFVISNKNYPNIDKTDIEIEIIQLNNFEEIKYILGMRDTFE